MPKSGIEIVPSRSTLSTNESCFPPVNITLIESPSESVYSLGTGRSEVVEMDFGIFLM